MQANRYEELRDSARPTNLEYRAICAKGPAQGTSGRATAAPEPFVDANTAAEFLCLRTRRVLELAREGAIPAHPLGDGQRKVWRFRLSELEAAMEARHNGGSSRPCSRNEEAA